MALKLEKGGSRFLNPCPSLPSVVSDDRNEFQCINIYVVLNNKKKTFILRI